jgi:ribosomal protein S18 acetylase RimI-like enzyme
MMQIETPREYPIISEATTDDAEALSVLVNSAYRGESSRQGWTTEADFLGGQRTSAALLHQEISGQDRKILCLRTEPNGPILGCVFLQLETSRQPLRCYLGMLTVKPTLQARGWGKYLMASAESSAREWGAESVILGVIQLRESLIAWYERRGYKKSGETWPFPYGRLQFGAPKRDDLYFVILEKSLKP